MKHVYLSILFCVIALYSCESFNKNKQTNIAINTSENKELSSDKYSLEVVEFDKNTEYAKKSIFKLLEHNKCIDSLEIEIPISDCDNSETVCGIDFINNSFKVLDLNNDTFYEIEYSFYYYAKSEQLPKKLKSVIFDTQNQKRYLIDGIGVNKFDELTLENPEGTVKYISQDTPQFLLQELKSEWSKYSFESKTSIKNTQKRVKIVKHIKKTKTKNELDNQNNLSNEIESVKLIGEDKEVIEILYDNNKIVKFDNPYFHSDHHKIELTNNQNIKLKNMDDRRSFIETYWYFDKEKLSLFMYSAYGESYDYGQVSKYKLDDVKYNIKTINSDSFYDLIYDDKNKITHSH